VKRADAYDAARSYAIRNVRVIQADEPGRTRAQAERIAVEEAMRRFGCALGPTHRTRLRKALREARAVRA
jgi:hypothetical protein